MFYGPLKEADTVKIAASTTDAFKAFLQMFYLPEVELTMENMDPVARLANKSVFTRIWNSSKTNWPKIENMACVYQLAISFDDFDVYNFDYVTYLQRVHWNPIHF